MQKTHPSRSEPFSSFSIRKNLYNNNDHKYRSKERHQHGYDPVRTENTKNIIATIAKIRSATFHLLFKLKTCTRCPCSFCSRLVLRKLPSTSSYFRASLVSKSRSNRFCNQPRIPNSSTLLFRCVLFSLHHQYILHNTGHCPVRLLHLHYYLSASRSSFINSLRFILPRFLYTSNIKSP